ncbi:hypothetical protein [Bacillus sp. B15-48]|nr:hypothetical protein [Bacillus sp. B15-48]MBM4762902.1 hypothetical protein [Bacillus sp. B15-48]
MLGLWLTTISIAILFFITLFIFYMFVKSSVNMEDAQRVDKLPKDDSN